MFAFAIWDGERNELLAVRDRLGIKPLYVAEKHGTLVFASEIRALMATDLISRRLDPAAVDQYLTYQAVPAPRTLLSDVSLLPPGCLCRFTPGGTLTVSTYWDLLDARDRTAAGHGAADARARVSALLDETTRIHLISDVPLGVFLSGGIDSSAVATLTARTGVVPRTFTVALPGTPHDESAFARSVAQHIGTDHTELRIDEAAFRDHLPDAIAATDHPSGDGINTYIVSRAVREGGITVALSGLGGDELFGGYPSFARLERLAQVGPALSYTPRPLRALAAAAIRAAGRRSVSSTKTAALLEGEGSVAQAYPVMRQLFSADDRRALLMARSVGVADPYVTLLEEAARRHPDADVMTLVSYAEARTYMHDVLLRDTDQMSMASALEVRVPLLDHRLAEYVMGLPASVKRPGPTPKRLLVESLGNALPDECVRRPKQGFVLPFDSWMKGDLREFCGHHLRGRGLTERAGLRQDAIAGLWAHFLEGNRRTSWSRPWSLVALGAWLERNDVSL